MPNDQLNSEQEKNLLPEGKKTNNSVADENINLGALYFKSLFLTKYVIRNWWVLLIWMLVGMGVAYGYMLYKGTTYTSEFAFNVVPSNNPSAILSNALALSSGMTQGPSTGAYDNNYFSNFIQSQRDIKSALLKDAVVKGKEDILANHFIDVYKWRGPWKNTKLQYFRFKNHDLYKLTPLEDSILTLEYNYIIKYVLSNNYVLGNPIVSIYINTPNKDFTRELSSRMCKCMNEYYLTDIYGRNVQNVNTAQHKVDSLSYVLKDLQTRIAHFNDNNYALIKQEGSTELNMLTRDLGLVTTMYNSAVSNLDAAKTTLIINTPLLDIMDDPEFSTVATFVRWVIALPLGALIGIFFGIVYLVIRKMVVDSARLEKQKIVKHLQSATG